MERFLKYLFFSPKKFAVLGLLFAFAICQTCAEESLDDSDLETAASETQIESDLMVAETKGGGGGAGAAAAAKAAFKKGAAAGAKAGAKGGAAFKAAAGGKKGGAAAAAAGAAGAKAAKAGKVTDFSRPWSYLNNFL